MGPGGLKVYGVPRRRLRACRLWRPPAQVTALGANKDHLVLPCRQPAGGRFRGGLGKLLFHTTLLAQSVLQPALVTNKVGGRASGRGSQRRASARAAAEQLLQCLQSTCLACRFIRKRTP